VLWKQWSYTGAVRTIELYGDSYTTSGSRQKKKKAKKAIKIAK
jgi:hypothetical protein